MPRHGHAYTIFAFAQYLQTLEGIAAIRPGSGTGVVHLLVAGFLEVASIYVSEVNEYVICTIMVSPTRTRSSIRRHEETISRSKRTVSRTMIGEDPLITSRLYSNGNDRLERP